MPRRESKEEHVYMRWLRDGLSASISGPLAPQVRLLLLLTASLAGFFLILEFLAALVASGPRDLLAGAPFQQDTFGLPTGAGLFEAVVFGFAVVLAVTIALMAIGWPPSWASLRPRPALVAGVFAAAAVAGLGAYLAFSGLLQQNVGYGEHTIHRPLLQPAVAALLAAVFLTLIIAGIINRYALALLIVVWLAAAVGLGVLDTRPVDGLHLFERPGVLTVPGDYAAMVDRLRRTDDAPSGEVAQQPETPIEVEVQQDRGVNVAVVPEQTAAQPRDPVFWVSGGRNVRYLRTATGDVYEGGGWTQLDLGHLPISEGDLVHEVVRETVASQRPAQNSDVPLERLDEALLAFPTVEAMEYVADAVALTRYWEGDLFREGFAPSVSHLTGVSVPASYYPFSATLRLPGPTVSYQLNAAIPRFAPGDLVHASPSADAAYLQLPEDLPPRVLQLAEGFRGDKSPYVRANDIYGFLTQKYAYAKPGPDGEYLERPPGHDPVDWFLFQQRWGDSGSFSTAFAVLARAAGIPARVVSGWAIEPGEAPRIVYADQAHQWAEIALDGIGWVTFDPVRSDVLPPEGYGAPADEVTEDLLASENPDVRQRAVEVLGDTAAAEALPVLVEVALSDESANVRFTAETVLHRIGVDELIRLLLHAEDPEVRAAAAWSLRISRSARAAAPLRQALSSDDVADVRMAALNALAYFRDEETAQAVLAAARSDPETAVRVAAVHALGARNPEWAVEALVKLLGADAVAEVREAAAVTLGGLEDGAALQPLLDARANDPAALVRVVAGEILEQWGLESLIRTLLSSEDAVERIAAALLLGERADPDSVPALGRALNDIHEGVREMALQALERMGILTQLENGSYLLTAHGGFMAIVPGTTAGPVPRHARLPLFEVTGASHTGRLRIAVGEVYADGEWRARQGPGVSYSPSAGPLPEEGILPTVRAEYVHTDSITLNSLSLDGKLPAGIVPTSKRLVGIDTGGTYWPESATFALAAPAGEYAWESVDDEFSEAQLYAAGRMPVPLDSPYTSLPEWAQRGPVHDLAVEITAGHATPYAQAKAIEEYLRREYFYGRPESSEAPAGQDPVERFLFSEGEGTSGSFSSAFVFLARALGIPARVVSGWAIGQTMQSQTVGTDQAHQWAEVAFEGLGWVDFDPTPGGASALAALTTLNGGDQQAVEEAVASLEEAGETVVRLENGGALVGGTEKGVQRAFAPGTTTLQSSGIIKTPAFRVSGAAGTPYLRTAVGDVYEGDRWRQVDPIALAVPSNTDVVEAVWRTYLRRDGDFAGLPFNRRANLSLFGVKLSELSYGATWQQINVLPLDHDGWLPLGMAPTSQDLLNVETDGTYYPFSNTFRSDERSQGYTYTSRTLTFPERQLRYAYAASDDTYLQLPDSLPQRVRDLAASVIASAHAWSPYEKAKALEHFLSTNYPYRFADSPDDHPPPGRDPVDWFLFDHQEGTCGVFSSAFVVMARAVGIPARVVSGWAIQPTDDEQIVYGDQAHQWAEIALSEIGWVPIEATAPGGPQSRIIGEPVPLEPTRLDTETTITEWPTEVRRNEPFTVGGTVLAATGHSIHNMTVEIYVNETKEHGGTKIGTVVTESGRWTAEVRMPPDLKRGPHQLLARAVENDHFNESWSDPDVSVFSGTGIELTGPARVQVDHKAEFSGRLSEDNGTSVEGQPVSIVVNGTETHTVTTGQLGRFAFSLIFVEPGPHWVEVQIDDQDFLLQNSVRMDIEVTLPSVTSVEAPVSVRMGEEFSVTGTLLGARGEPLAGRSVAVFVGDLSARTTLTDDVGAFALTSALGAPGGFAVRAEFAGDGPVLASGATTNVAVREAALLTLAGPSAIERGQGATVSGKLSLVAGSPIGEVELRIVDHGGADLAVVVTDEAGGFSYQHPPVYATGPRSLTVEYAGEAYVEATSGLVSFAVLAPTRLALETPNVVRAGETFTLRGSLRDLNGEPVPDAQIQVGGSVSRALTTDADGAFRWENLAALDERSAYSPYESPFIVEAAFAGSEHFAPASAASDLTIGVARLLLAPLGPAARGDAVTVRGTALVGDTPLAGIEVTIDGKSGAQSDETGAFIYTHEIPGDAPLGAGELTVSAPGAAATTIVPLIVKSAVTLVVTPVDDVRPGEPALMQLTLLDDKWRGVGDATLRAGAGVEAVTDRFGMALVEIAAPDDHEARIAPVTFTFDGDDLRMPLTYFVGVPITPVHFNWLLWAGVPVLLAALGAAGYAGRRLDVVPLPAFVRPRIGDAAPAGEPAIAGSHESMEDEGTVEAPTPVTMTINFDGIEPDLPLVWEPGEEVALVVRAVDAKGNALAGAGVVVSVNSDTPTELVIGDDGTCALLLTAGEAGEHAATAHFDGDEAHEPSGTSAAFRVVSYQEEIIRLYNLFLDWARQKTSSHLEQSTPREVELLLVSSGLAVPQKPLDELISRFEEADYSEHPIERRHYQSMYRSWRVVVGE